MVLIIILYALLASSFTMGKVLLYYTTPMFLTGCRMFTAGTLLLSYQYFNNHKQFIFKKKHIWWYLQIIILGIYVNYVLRLWGLKYLTSSKACFLYNLSPFLSAYYSYLFFQEQLTRKQWAGLFIGFIGMIPMLVSTSPAEKSMGEWAYVSWPELAILLSVTVSSYSWTVVRKLVKDKNYSPIMINGMSMTAGGILALLTSFIFEADCPVTATGPFFLWLTLIILISNIICHNLYGHLLTQYTTTFVAFGGFLSPLFAAFYGYLFLHETITWHFYLASCIVFLGLLLFYQDELAQKKKLVTPADQELI
jgi:drug/metabolite transporter (DMT)-like permease